MLANVCWGPTKVNYNFVRFSRHFLPKHSTRSFQWLKYSENLHQSVRSPQKQTKFWSKMKPENYLVTNYRRKFIKDTKVWLSKECITQHKLFICNILVRKLKDTNRKIILKRKIYWNYMKLGSGEIQAPTVRVFKGTVLRWFVCRSSLKNLKGNFLQASERTCR